MHLCFSSKVLGDISSYTGQQNNIDDMCDIAKNSLASDEYSSYKTTKSQLRKDIENYFIENYKLQLITKN